MARDMSVFKKHFKLNLKWRIEANDCTINERQILISFFKIYLLGFPITVPGEILFKSIELPLMVYLPQHVLS